MRVSPDWLAKVDTWRRSQTDLPPRADAIRRLVGMGLRFGLAVGDRVSTPVGAATVIRVVPATGCVWVETKKGDGHMFSLSDIETVD